VVEDVDAIKGLAAGAGPAIDGAATELEVGVETTGNRFLIRVAAEDLVHFLRWMASA
jgi:hypothetical protein